MRARLFALGASFAILTSSGLALGLQGSPAAERARSDAAADPSAKAKAGKESSKQPRGRPARDGSQPTLSIGSPTRGRLSGAHELESRDALLLRKPARAPFGLPELVGMLSRAAERVRGRYPGSVLLVGDLSSKQGGPIAGHRSHESGRDADVGFYFVDRRGKVQKTDRFLSVLENGRAKDRPELAFDERRNWALVQAWLTDPKTRVQHIFVSKALRSRLLAYARAGGVYVPVLHRAALALKQPSRGLSHDDHFHVRIACPPGQRDVCQAEPQPSRRKQRVRRAKPERIAQLRESGASAAAGDVARTESLALVKTR